MKTETARPEHRAATTSPAGSRRVPPPPRQPTPERQADPNWWRGAFNLLYLRTERDEAALERLTRAEADLVVRLLAPGPADKILDLCCGTGRHSLELARRGFFHVEGLDRSHHLVNRARSTAKREGLAVRFREGDARDLAFAPDSFDTVLMMGGSFGFFETANDDLQVLREVRKALKPWGRLLIELEDGNHLREHFTPRGWDWLDDKHFLCRERTLSRDGLRLISRDVVTRTDQGVVADQFYAFKLYTPEALTALLKEAGFTGIQVREDRAPEGTPAEDREALAHQVVVTCQVRKEWAPVRQKPKGEVRDVVVVQGDPRKEDKVKLGGRFDEDDFYTIDQMKAALRELPACSASFLNNHDTLFRDLQDLRGKPVLVFNICDEGYGNDPMRELHVPVMLELMGIPYTGAGPRCLAFCFDKSLVRGAAREMGIPVPEAVFLKPEDSTFDFTFPLPAIVKPNRGDSSYGITARCVAYKREQILDAVSEIRTKFGCMAPLLVEEFLPGADLSLGIIGNPPASYTVLPITEEDYSGLPPDLPKICGFEAKWQSDTPYSAVRSVRANITEEVEKFLVDASLKLFERLECRDYARFDWRMDVKGVPKLLEVNPNPGWCWDGHLRKMAGLAGGSYSGMLGSILRAAEDRVGPAAFQARRPTRSAAAPQAKPAAKPAAKRAPRRPVKK